MPHPAINQMDDLKVGEHCAYPMCNQRDFLPYKCPECAKNFCGDHRHVSCSAVLPSPDTSEIIVQSSPDCMMILQGCKNRGIANCALCKNLYCLEHRFEDTHPCQAVQHEAQEETKFETQKKELLNRIKAKNDSQVRTTYFPSGRDLKQRSIQQKVQRMKAKSGAKGNPTIPKDERYAVTISFENGTQHLLYFRAKFSVGQVLDQVCKEHNIIQVTDFNNVDETQLRVYAVQLQDEALVLIPFETKISQITQTDFYQGDLLVLQRQLINQMA